MRYITAALLALASAGSGFAQDRPIQPSIPPPTEWVHIDGSRSPELIPEWSVWRLAFKTLQTVGMLPTVVHTQVSDEEAKVILAAAAEHKKNTTECEQRGLQLVSLLKTETVDVINRKTEALNLECRWQTLRLRDRVLDGLKNDGRAALQLWVESLKASIQVSVPKRELDFYLKPK